jgi:ribosome recycling factor
MAYDFSSLKKKIADIENWLTQEFSSIRTGRATPALLDTIRVESYGTKVPLNQVGTTLVEDARTLRITPWDPSQSKEIEKAISMANLGVSVSVDDRGLRVFFPELTAERRTILLKLMKEKLEEARVSLRSERDRVWADIQQQEKQKSFGEDEKFRYKDEMQKLIDAGGEKLDAHAQRKEKEILS